MVKKALPDNSASAVITTYAHVIFVAFGEPFETLAYMSCDATFSAIIANARDELQDHTSLLPSDDPKDFVVFAGSQRSNQMQLALSARATPQKEYKDLIPAHSFILRNVTSSSRLNAILRHAARHIDLSQDFSIVIRSKISISSQIIAELYPKFDLTMRLVKISKKWSLKDLPLNLDPATLDQAQEGSDRSENDDSNGEAVVSVIEQLFSGNKKHLINTNMKADATIVPNTDEALMHPRYFLSLPVYLQRILNAENSFKVIDSPNEPDNHSSSYLRNLTTRLDRVYERATYYASNAGQISSSSLTVLIVPILDDIFVDHLAEYEGAFDLALEKQPPEDIQDSQKDQKLKKPKMSKKDLKKGQESSEQEGTAADGDDDKIYEELVSGEEFKTLGDQNYFTFWFSDPEAINQVLHQNGKPIYNTPRPDRIVLLYGYPLVLVEVISDPSKTDEIRGIGQGCAVNRILNAEGITAKDTNEVVTIAVYVDAAMVVTIHFLTSQYVAGNVIPPHKIPIQHRKRSFDLSRAVKRDESGRVTDVLRRSEAVDLVKFLYDIKRFLHEHYPPECQEKLARIVKEAQDFSLLVRTACDTRSLSNASKQFSQKYGPNSKGRSSASDSTSQTPVPASGSVQSSRKSTGRKGNSGLAKVHEEVGQVEGMN